MASSRSSARVSASRPASTPSVFPLVSRSMRKPRRAPRMSSATSSRRRSRPGLRQQRQQGRQVLLGGAVAERRVPGRVVHGQADRLVEDVALLGDERRPEVADPGRQRAVGVPGRGGQAAVDTAVAQLEDRLGEQVVGAVEVVEQHLVGGAGGAGGPAQGEVDQAVGGEVVGDAVEQVSAAGLAACGPGRAPVRRSAAGPRVAPPSRSAGRPRVFRPGRGAGRPRVVRPGRGAGRAARRSAQSVRRPAARRPARPVRRPVAVCSAARLAAQPRTRRARRPAGGCGSRRRLPAEGRAEAGGDVGEDLHVVVGRRS